MRRNMSRSIRISNSNRQGGGGSGRNGKKKYTPKDSRVMNALKMYQNPFSNGTTNPKIPDGKATWSLGCRFVTPLTNIVTTNVANMYDYIILTPGRDGCLINVSNAAALAIPAAESPLAFAGGITNDVRHNWRVVSCGMKVMCTSQVGTNDGYWEAVRGPSQFTELTDDSMVTHPTYQTGKLRDIGRMLFQLKPQGRDHDFSDDGDLYDNQFDSIVIRISSGTQPTTLTVQSVENQEIICQPGHVFTRFQTHGIPAEYELKRVQDRLQMSMMPGKTVSY